MSATPLYQLADSIRRMEPVKLSQEQQRRLEALSRQLEISAPAMARESSYRLVTRQGEELELPEQVFSLLERIIEVLASGDAITLVPVGKALTTQQAANILNVSRQYLVRLLDEGRIPHTRTGTHRRVRMDDVMAFKRQRDRDRMASLDDLSALTQDFGGYDLSDSEE